MQPDIGLASALDMMLGLDGALPVVGLIGAQLSSVSMPIATLGGVRGVPQVSMSATNADLSNKDSFPTSYVPFRQTAFRLLLCGHGSYTSTLRWRPASTRQKSMGKVEFHQYREPFRTKEPPTFTKQALQHRNIIRGWNNWQ